MSLPSFINVVTLTVSKRVEAAYVNGVQPLYADNVSKYVSMDAISPDSGDVVLGQAQIGVQRQTKNASGGVNYIGSNAFKIVTLDNSLFTFEVPATKETQLDPQSQGKSENVTTQPSFTSNVVWS